MLKLTTEQRSLVADKMGDAATLGLGGLVIGQILSDRPFSLAVGIGGVVLWIALIGVAIIVRGDAETQA